MSSYKLLVCSMVYIGTTHTSNTEKYWHKLKSKLSRSTPRWHKEVVEVYRCADKLLAQTRRKQANVSVRMA